MPWSPDNPVIGEFEDLPVFAINWAHYKRVDPPSEVQPSPIAEIPAVDAPISLDVAPDETVAVTPDASTADDEADAILFAFCQTVATIANIPPPRTTIPLFSLHLAGKEIGVRDCALLIRILTHHVICLQRLACPALP